LDRRLRLGHGRAFAVYVVGYAFGRFWIELVRTDPATMVFNVRINVWTMTLLFIGGVLYFLLARSRGPREDPAAFGGGVEPVEPLAEAAASEESTSDDEQAAEPVAEKEKEEEEAATDSNATS
ncbi:MAG TPA: prolipoprotein diacylglyceryl transferase family protein, partial [Pseudonocardiaceae bacterium]